MGEMIDSIIGCMSSSNGMSDIQRIQTEHRLKLAQFWAIKAGSRILEIGCGQGDTTAVLAYLVGEKGFVHGVDRASPTYGGPITVGDSAKFLMNSKLGKRIKMEFEIDLLSPEIEFPEDFFDMVVLSHCSWYLKSIEELGELLKRARKWGKQLAFAEWDSRINSIEQLPHLLAVLIQAQYECFKEESDSNIRTLFTPHDVRVLSENAGWIITSEKTISSPELQDGKWELNKTLTDYQTELSGIRHMPPKLKSLIQSEVSLLEESIKNNVIRPMSTYVFVAQ
jgi:SAM-dependent methyltransferase